jgi:hypothetical protein
VAGFYTWLPGCGRLICGDRGGYGRIMVCSYVVDLEP